MTELTRQQLNGAIASDALLSIAKLEAKISLKKTCIYDMIAAGQFPMPVKIGAASRWPASTIDEWIAQRKRQTYRAAA